MAWYGFTFNGEPPAAAISEVEALAGPKWIARSRRLVAPVNVAWRVEQTLTHLGVDFRVHAPRLPEPLPEVPLLPDDMRALPSGMDRPFPEYLTPYQKDAIRFCASRPGSFCWHSPGAGKTITAIVWGCHAPGLIVFVTRAAARGTIAKEIRRVTLHKPLVITGEQPVEIPEDTRFVVIGWEGLPFHIDALERAKPVSVVFDESHKGKSNKRWIAEPKRDDEGNAVLREDGGIVVQFKARNNTANAAHRLSICAKRRLATTASPIKDRLRDLWAQLDLVEPRAWGVFKPWAVRYCGARENEWGGLETGGRGPAEVLEELSLRLSFIVHSVPYSVTHADLPAKRRLVTYLGAESLTKGHDYKAVKGGWGLNGVEAQAFAKLRSAADMKRSAAVQMVVEAAAKDPETDTGGKVVVFTALRKDCEKFHAALESAAKGKGIKTWYAHGDHSPTERDRIREEYMAHPGPCVLVGTGDAWGESVNLQDTDVAFIVMLPWTPGQICQWEGRFARRGQKRPVLIHYLIAEGTYDEIVASMLIDKLPSIERVVGDEELQDFGREIGGIADEAAVMAAMVERLATNEVFEEDARA